MSILKNKLLLITLLAFGLMSFVHQTANSVKMQNHNKQNLAFKIKKVNIEWVNGKVNLATVSTNNKIIQLNNLTEVMLKDTTFRHKGIDLIFMDGQKAFKSVVRFKPLVEVTCAGPKAGNTISLNVQGKVYYQKAWYNINMQVSQKLPAQKFISTQTSH